VNKFVVALSKSSSVYQENSVSSQMLRFPIPPNPAVERGMYSPTKQPRALDLGDVGKEVERQKKFNWI